MRSRRLQQHNLVTFVYLYHLDTFQHVQIRQVVSLLPMNDLHHLMIVEPVCVRAVDDRRSMILASQIEQRLVSRVCHEFAQSRASDAFYCFWIGRRICISSDTMEKVQTLQKLQALYKTFEKNNPRHV